MHECFSLTTTGYWPLPSGAHYDLLPVRVLLAFTDVGLGIPLQEALETLGRETRWDPSAVPSTTGADPPDVVVLDGDGAGTRLGELAEAWRALDPAPGVLALGMTADTANRAAAAHVTLVPPSATPATPGSPCSGPEVREDSRSRFCVLPHPGATAADYLRESLEQPGAYIVPGYADVMPRALTRGLPDFDRDALVAYLASLE
jgi:hypothetical protein